MERIISDNVIYDLSKTSNFIESMFRVFTLIFLRSKSANRVDTLVQKLHLFIIYHMVRLEKWRKSVLLGKVKRQKTMTEKSFEDVRRKAEILFAEKSLLVEGYVGIMQLEKYNVIANEINNSNFIMFVFDQFRQHPKTYSSINFNFSTGFITSSPQELLDSISEINNKEYSHGSLTIKTADNSEMCSFIPWQADPSSGRTAKYVSTVKLQIIRRTY